MRTWLVVSALATVGTALLPGQGAPARKPAAAQGGVTKRPAAPRKGAPRLPTSRKPARPATSPARPVVAAAVPLVPVDPVLAALDASVQRGPLAGGGEALVVSRTLADGWGHARLVARFGSAASLAGRTVVSAMLTDAIRQQVATLGGTVSVMVDGPQDPLGLGTDTPGILGLEAHGPAAEVVPALQRAWERVRTSAPDTAAIAQARRSLVEGLERAAQHPTLAGYAALERALRPYAAGHPRGTPSIEDALDAARRTTVQDVQRLREQVLQSVEVTVAAVGPNSLEEVRRAFANAATGASGYQRVVSVYSPTTPGRTVVNTPPMGWSLVTLGVAIPLRDEDPDWLPLQVATWILGGSPTQSRFPTVVPGAMGGGATLEAGRVDRATIFSASAVVEPARAGAALEAWTRAIEGAARTGFTEAEVRSATTEWLAGRRVMRENPRLLPRLLTARAEQGRSFVQWDGALEARGRGLTAAEVSEVFRRRVPIASMVTIVSGPAR